MRSAWLLAGLASTAVAASTWAQAWAQVMDFDKVEIVTERLAPNVYC